MSYDDWPEEPVTYLRRDDPRCRRHTSELETNCRLCRSEAIADHTREPENVQPAAFADRPNRKPLRLVTPTPINPRRNA